MAVDGILLLDKPGDRTSHDVVAGLRKALKQKAIGHTGTLDPIATGLMVIVLGEATKLSDYLVSADKAYTVLVRLGVETDTLDRAGKVTSTKPVTSGRVDLELAVSSLEGSFEWQVPIFSAAKVAGQRLYDLARAQIKVDLPIKSMNYWDIVIGPERSDGLLEVSLQCSKGSFIRTWVQKLSQQKWTKAVS